MGKRDLTVYSDGYIENGQQNGNKGPFKVVALLCLLLVVGVFVIMRQSLRYAISDVTPSDNVSEPPISSDARPSSNPGDIALPISEIPSGGMLSYSDVYAKAVKSVVAIYPTRRGKVTSAGTGIVLTSDGCILTNSHILEVSEGIDIVFADGASYTAAIFALDTISDIAILQIDADDLTPAEFGNSAQIGERLLLLGNPLNGTLLLTDGILSGVSRNTYVNGYPLSVMITNAAIGDGHSGAPLLNLYGQVIGVANSRLRVDSSAVDTSGGMNFALSSETVKEIVDNLLKYGRIPNRPSLGVTLSDLSSDYAEFIGVPQAPIVRSITNSNSTLRIGDLITAIDGISVFTVAELMREVNTHKVGDNVTLTVWRSQKAPLEMNVTITELSGG